MKLYLGTSKVDITPKNPVPLAGFAIRENMPFEAVRTPIYARILFFRHVDETGVFLDAVVVSADLIWWGKDRMDRIRKRMESLWGLKPGSVVLNATHSHSGPQTSLMFHRMLGEGDLEYITLLEKQLFDGIEQAIGNLEPVQIEHGIGKSYIGVQRRKYADDKVYNIPNLEGLMDPDVNVFRFNVASKKTKALMVHYTCHPVTTQENVLSSEFTGVSMSRLEEQLGDDIVCLYLQGCCGDINIHVESADPALGTEEEKVVYFGEKLAETVMKVLKGKLELLCPVPLTGSYHTLLLKLQPLPTADKLKSLAEKGDSPFDEWACEMLKRMGRREKQLLLEMNRLDLAKGLSLLTMNAEVVVEYGLFIKRRSANRVLPVAYTNGMIGYIPTSEQHKYGSYEADLSTYYFNLPAKLHPSTEKALYNKLNEILQLR